MLFEWTRTLRGPRKTIHTLLTAALGCIVIDATTADDTEIYFNAESIPPNVLFVVDVSGSMNWKDETPFPDIPGNVLWLDANDKSTIFDAQGESASKRWSFSGNVAQWRDKSGNGHHLTGTSTTLDTINGRSTVRFTNDTMTGPDIFNGSISEATIFFVQQENASSRNFFLNFNGDSYQSGRVSFHSPWGRDRRWYWDSGGSSNNRTFIPKSTKIGDITQVTAYKSVAENKKGFILNNNIHSLKRTNTKATSSPTSGGMYFGRSTHDHELAEIIVYDRLLTDAEMQLVQDYLDKKWRTRLDRVKFALNSLLESAEGVNAGLISYSTNTPQFQLRNEIKPIEQSRESLINNINNLSALGGTPTQSAMFEALRYYRGEPPLAMGSSSKSDPPPVTQCQGNHIVLLTDGIPSGSTWWSTIGDYIGSDCALNRGDNRLRGNCGIELASYMNNTDQYPSVRGMNNITTHTIGLSLDMPWLNDMATTGGGGYYTVETSDQLLSAFESIMASTVDQSTTFVAPAVTIDQFSQLSHRDDTYLALFEPTQSMRWPGNLKRYSFSGNPPAIRDKNNSRVLDTKTGKFKTESHSFWSDEPDGNSINLGGAASKLDAFTRKVTTYTSNGTNFLLDSRNRVHEDNAGRLGTWINVKGEELKNLLAWARGVDVDDEDNDGSTENTRKQMGDPLHSKPAILTYGGSTDDPDSVVFIGTNEGYLHAINSSDGTELYSFIPPELLGNLKTFYENAKGYARPYGLDGDLTLWVDDKNQNGLLDVASEHAYLYIGMRRGGKNYYALDVTNKDNPKYLWTIKGGSDQDFKDLGQSWSKPVKTKIQIAGDARDVLIFGGGYDTAQDQTTTRTADQTGNTLFVVDALDGSLIWNASAAKNPAYANMIYSLPSDPTVIDIDGDGTTDQIYIGDMGGQVWRFDVNKDSRKSTEIISGGLIADLATDEEINNRRFFYPPDVSLVSQNGYYYLSLAIGSGNRAHPLDRNVDNRFYMIRQDAIYNAPDGYGTIDIPATTSQPASYRPINEADLYDATANDINSTNKEVSLAAKGALEDSLGWVLHLQTAGEKVLGMSATINNSILFATYLPDIAGQSQEDRCKPAIGGNRAYIVNLFDAAPIDGATASSRYKKIEQSGIAGTVSVIVDNGDGTPSNNTWSVNAVIALDPLKIPAMPLTRRTYWSEVPDY